MEQHPTDLPPVVRRALDAECGNPLLEEGAVDSTTHDALNHVVQEDGWPEEQRNRAVYLLGLWPDDDTVAMLERTVDRLDERGRMAAASVLARVHSEVALDLLGQLAGDESEDVRRVAINAIGESPVPEAERMLRRIAADDGAESNRQRAADMLST